MLEHINLSTLAKAAMAFAVAWFVFWVAVFEGGFRPLDWIVNTPLDANATFMGLMVFSICLGPVFVKVLIEPFRQ